LFIRPCFLHKGSWANKQGRVRKLKVSASAASSRFPALGGAGSRSAPGYCYSQRSSLGIGAGFAITAKRNGKR
jgi:hypothetical protein